MIRTTTCESRTSGQLRQPMLQRVARRVTGCAGLVAAAATMLGGAGCEEEFDPASKLQSLRVMGVQADNPYPVPGQKVSLKILWHDGKSPVDSPRQVQIAWLGGCFNPPGDLYFQCFAQLAEKFAAIEKDPSLIDQLLGFGDTFGIDIPEDLISSRPAPEEADAYGLTVVFFAACAGTLRPAEPGEDGLPFGCFDAAGERLGADDYVPGYTMLYSYDGRTNANPILNGLLVDGKLVDPSTEPVYPRCTDERCRDLKINAAVDPASAERNTGLVDGDGNALSEQMWVEYLATGGEVDRSPRLVNDATKGFSDDNGTAYKPPSEAGKQYIFTVVRDNRGGVAWVKQGFIFE